MRSIRFAAVFLALVGSSACGTPSPLVCPAGTTPRAGACVPSDQQDAGITDRDDGSVLPLRDGGREHRDAFTADAGTDTGPSCVPTGEVDQPDPMRVDSDCDGIDGSIEAAVFVAPSGTDTGSGGMFDPAASIARAIEIAIADGRTQVLVANGDYSEQFELHEGVSVFGGYDDTDDAWARSDMRATVRAAGPVLSATDIASATTVAQLRIEALDAIEPGSSSIGARLVRSSGVRFESVEIIAGRGADGLSPPRPAALPQAATGRPGAAGVLNGLCPSTWPVSATPPPVGTGGGAACGCVSGGSGGAAGSFSGSAARAGSPGMTPPPRAGMFCYFAGGAGGSGGIGGSTGGVGGDGRLGAPGVSGVGAGPIGAFDEHGYSPASGTAGARGSVGDGGGGGGGGDSTCSFDSDAFCVASGGAGGGGGAGGCGGDPGSGGGGGGASVALYLWDSTPTLVRVTLRSADGGNGGAGARGGEGARGGDGGLGGAAYTARSCTTGRSARGGDGGRGGQGGEGGGGGGGTGGPSIGLLLGRTSMQSAESVGVSVTTGIGGMRGAGGGTAAAGENGTSQPTLDVP